jgi:hypothetical protein
MTKLNLMIAEFGFAACRPILAKGYNVEVTVRSRLKNDLVTGGIEFGRGMDAAVTRRPRREIIRCVRQAMTIASAAKFSRNVTDHRSTETGPSAAGVCLRRSIRSIRT